MTGKQLQQVKGLEETVVKLDALRCRQRRETGEGPATNSGFRNPPIENMFIGLSCGADQCGFNQPKPQGNYRLETKSSGLECRCLKIFLRKS